jgi:hypothetical protein
MHLPEQAVLQLLLVIKNAKKEANKTFKSKKGIQEGIRLLLKVIIG